MMNTPILAKDVGPLIYQMLVKSVENEYKGATESEKQEAIARILAALSYQVFK